VWYPVENPVSEIGSVYIFPFLDEKMARQIFSLNSQKAIDLINDLVTWLRSTIYKGLA
jgi:hypothetical protein